MENKPSPEKYFERLFSAARIKGAEQDARSISKNSDSFLELMQKDGYTLEDALGCSQDAALITRLVAALTSRRITDRFPVGSKYSDDAVKEYVVGLLFGFSHESVALLLFDKRKRFIAAEFLSDGTVSASEFLPRKLVEAVLRNKASFLVLAHNHPCGIAKISDADIIATSEIMRTLKRVDAELLHHYVVSGYNVADCIDAVNAERERAIDCISSLVVNACRPGQNKKD
ncbi:MAG: JAB domain-containing protein [Clostridia bacterium]|nr:JAB domain-containing protein [Clostridia bacterium]